MAIPTVAELRGDAAAIRKILLECGMIGSWQAGLPLRDIVEDILEKCNKHQLADAILAFRPENPEPADLLGWFHSQATAEEAILCAMISQGQIRLDPVPGVDDAVSTLRRAMLAMTDDERVALWSRIRLGYCQQCGGGYLPCFCDPCFDV